VTNPIVNVRFSLDFECKYNPFKGRTPEEYADLLETDLHEILKEFREDEIESIFSTLEKVTLCDLND
jgi:hypothetical protein